jgi:hypothetical protein
MIAKVRVFSIVSNVGCRVEYLQDSEEIVLLLA